MSATRTRKGQWLLALLVLNAGRTVARERLAAMLWPDSTDSQALANLRFSLNNLRHVLGPEARRLLTSTPHSLRLDLVSADCDLLAFDAAIARGDTAGLQEAVSLYGGSLLEGCHEEWALLERQAREQAYLNARETLAREALTRPAPAEAARHLRALLAIDPLRERTQRALMEALAAMGDYAAVTQTYRDFRLLLHEEMQTAPALETRTLYQRLRKEGQQRAEQKEGRKTKPPLPDTEPRLRNLPRPITTLIGREEAIQEVTALLAKARLVTLTGAGGVGKTRLAIAVVEVVEPDFADGICFVDLAPLSDAALLPQAVAAALQLRPASEHSLEETLQAFLERKELLLVLDNCEHLLMASAALSQTLLSACPGLRILATSRQVLGIVGERRWRVPSLSLPDLSALTQAGKEALDYLLECSSAQLFVERAQAVYSPFRVTAQNCTDIGQACCLLEGIPFALELAAAWVRVLPVVEIIKRIEERLDLLISSDRSSPSRQQTLKAALDWSYSLLAEEEKHLLRQLSVFAGGFTLAAAEAVCRKEQSSPTTLLLHLARLVDQSLVVYEERDGEARYRLLETTRHYAREKLQQSGEKMVIGAQHRDYFLGQLESGLDGRVERYDWDRVKWNYRAEYRRWCEVERDNCREALRFSLEELNGGRQPCAWERSSLVSGSMPGSSGRGLPG